MSITYLPNGKIKAHHFTMEQMEEADNHSWGYCVACGGICDCCEPDVREYKCGFCGEKQVYGVMELILMGYVEEGK